MKKLDSWAVAAAVLLNRGDSMHYTEITRSIEETELTSIGLKGETTAQTIGAILRKHRKIFRSDGSGYYGLVDSATVKKIPLVQMALRRILMD